MTTRPTRSLRCHAAALMLACSSFMLTGCATVATVEMAAADMLIPPSQEAQLGAQYAAEIEKEVPVFNDAEATAWVQDLGKLLVEYSPPCEQQFTFKVAADPSLNAFAIPGGFCYVNVGLIAAADNEAEVAAVMGHEVNHVVRRHGMRGLVRAYGFQMVSDRLTAAGGSAGQLAAFVTDTGGVLTVRRFGREDEREADTYGVEAMYHAGFDPRAAVTFFEKLKSASGGGDSGMLGQLLSTHPATQERIDNIKAQIATYQLTGKERLDSAQFQRVKARAQKWLADNPQSQG